VDSVLELSEIGKIAHRCWAAIPEHFPSVILGEFVIMPNHLHGIVVIDKENAIADDNPVGLSQKHMRRPLSLFPGLFRKGRKNEPFKRLFS
jgi:REP element-mobilizing transposase RayT